MNLDLFETRVWYEYLDQEDGLNYKEPAVSHNGLFGFTIIPTSTRKVRFLPFTMGQPSFQASNAIIYLTYGSFLYVPSDFVAFLSVSRTNFFYYSTVELQAFG